jgi:carbonic anhydrase
MTAIRELFGNNRRWAEKMETDRPGFFRTLAAQQSPRYLWIGCADSRVPANEIVGLLPGELFVHRNVANLVVHTDLNALSVIQYAVEVLEVEHIIVCGHYGCGGVRAAMEHRELGLIDNWLLHIRDLYAKHHQRIARLDEDERLRRLCELNVIEQARNVAHTSIVQAAWRRGAALSVHAWVYGIEDGRLHDLAMSVSGADEISRVYRLATGIDSDGSD